MGFSYRDFFLARTKFCCCIPVRVGVIIMAVLGIIFSAVLSIALWYELSGEHPNFMSILVLMGFVSQSPSGWGNQSGFCDWWSSRDLSLRRFDIWVSTRLRCFELLLL